MFKFVRKWFRSGRIMLLLCGFGVTLLLCVLYATNPLFLKLLDYRIYDTMLRKHATAEPSTLPVIVDMDEKSLAEIGQYPWPRYQFVRLLDQLKHAGARSVGLDIVFAEPDRTSPVVIKEQIKAAFSQHIPGDIRFLGLPDLLLDNDKLFAQMLSAGPFALGYSFLFSGGDEETALSTTGDCAIIPFNPAVKTREPGIPTDLSAYLSNASGVVCPIPILANAAPSSGFFNTAPDADGVIRRVPLLISYNGNSYPSLALSALMQAMGRQTGLMTVSRNGTESIRLGKTIIPLDGRGQILVNFRGPKHSYTYISASDVINGDPEALAAVKDKIVFVGTSATGLKDIRVTPLDQTYPGVETHAAILDSIVQEDFIRIPVWAIGAEVLALLLAGIATTLLLAWTSAVWLALPFVVLAASMWFGSSYLFGTHHLYISPLYPFIALGLNFALLTALKFWREESQKRFIHGAFSHYLAPAVIERIVDDPGALSLEGSEKEVTVMFSDVRSFTSLSEKLTPTQVTDLLHDYLTPMTRIITEHHGTLDKFIGDAVMAFWNAPLDVEDHPRLAVRSALAQLERLERLNVDFQEKFGFTIKIGLGIHTGVVRVGNMGSADLFDYTLIGDPVNLASRLEGLTKFYGQEIVVSEVVREAVGDEFICRELDSVRVKGKVKPITIFTVYDSGQARNLSGELDRWAEGLAMYKAMRFADAGEVFASLQAEHPSVLHEMYAVRCRDLAADPPEEGWDGVYTHKTK